MGASPVTARSTIAYISLAPDASRECVAAFLRALADATGHPRLSAIAERETKPLGGRRRIDRSGEIRRLDFLLEHGIARSAAQAAKFVVRELGHDANSESAAVAGLLQAWRIHRGQNGCGKVDKN